MLLAGRGFVLSKAEAEALSKTSSSAIKPYINGRELISARVSRYVVDFYGVSAEQARTEMPAAYQHLLSTVKPIRDTNNRASYRQNWWVFAEPRREFRPALQGLSRYIATTETTKHRHFQFLDGKVVPDHMIVAFASPDAYQLAVLSSRHHVHWATQAGGWLGIGNDPRYSKSRCFDPFPFPDPSEELRQKLRDAGEGLDAVRKRVLAEHPDLTLTGLYNVLEKLRIGAALTEKDEDVKDRGLILIMKELHETIDRLTSEAYGWPANLTNEQILERLVALNAERAKEEAAGNVRWLRPDYQIPRFAKSAAAKTGELGLGETVVTIDRGKPVFPKDRYEQPLAVEAMLASSASPMDAAAIARGFRSGGKKIEQRVTQVLTTLARYGRVTALPGGKFAARKAA
jgi:hypothetical protein